MKFALVFLLCAIVAFSLAEGRRRKRAVSVTLRATPRVAVAGLSPQLKLDCRPPPTVDNVLLAVLIHMEKTDENGTVSMVASQRINALDVMDDNRTSADAYLQSSESDSASFLTVTIKEPVIADSGNYTCRFAYIDVSWNVHSLGSMITNVTVTDLPPADYIPEVGCECDQIWAEIDNLRATLVAENKRLKEQKVVVAGEPVSDSCRTSFSARFQTRHGYAIYGDQPAVFDDVISNKGNAYDPATGIFTAPCPGQYFFTVTLRTNQDLDAGYVDGVIQVNGEAKARTSVFLDSPVMNLESATNGVVLTLDEGAEVSVLIKTTSSGEFEGEEYSLFSGFYLSP